MASNGVGCVYGAWIVGVAHIATAVAFLVLKPFRLPSDAWFAPLGLIIVGVTCFFKAMEEDSTSTTVGSSLAAVTAALHVGRTFLGAWAQWRERHLRPLNPQSPKQSFEYPQSSDGKDEMRHGINEASETSLGILMQDVIVEEEPHENMFASDLRNVDDEVLPKHGSNNEVTNIVVVDKRNDIFPVIHHTDVVGEDDAAAGLIRCNDGTSALSKVEGYFLQARPNAVSV